MRRLDLVSKGAANLVADLQGEQAQEVAEILEYSRTALPSGPYFAIETVDQSGLLRASQLEDSGVAQTNEQVMLSPLVYHRRRGQSRWTRKRLKIPEHRTGRVVDEQLCSRRFCCELPVVGFLKDSLA
jgi:hypothetical protein